MPEAVSSAKPAWQLVVLLAVGLAGAGTARALGTPIPFLIGSLVASAGLSLTYFARTGQRLWYPQPLRMSAVGVIGVMIGSTVDSEILGLLPTIWKTLLALVVFVVLAQGLGYAVFRWLGRYDRVTATYCAMPGGLIEAVALGEKAGGDVETLSLQHFVRIVLVVLSVPTLFYLWTGEVVGSAAGQAMAQGESGWLDWALFLVLVPLGVVLGRLIRLPAAPMTGPMLLTAALQATGVIHLIGPNVLLNMAQLVVGTGLGAMFARSTLRRLAIGLGLGVVAVSLTLGLGVTMATLLAPHVPMGFDSLVLSFAPGGVTEMSLIALSLGISPVIVTAHHLFRIFFTVSVAGYVTRRFGSAG